MDRKARMTTAQVMEYISAGTFHRWVHSLEFGRLGVEFERRLQDGEWISVEQAAKHFRMPYAVFRFLFAHHVAACELSEPGKTRH